MERVSEQKKIYKRKERKRRVKDRSNRRGDT